VDAWLTQVFAVTLLNLKSLPRRLSVSLVVVVGIAGVVAIMVAVLSIGEGFRKTMTAGRGADTVVVFRSGTDTEMNSSLDRDEARILADSREIRSLPGIGRLASAELLVMVDLPKRSTGSSSNVPLRGVEPAAFAIRPGLRIVEGRPFKPGTRELIVGRGAQAAFGNTEVGSVLRLGQNDWTIVGVFTAEGSVAESELWSDGKVLMPAYRRGGFQSLYARLGSAEDIPRFTERLMKDPRLSIKVMPEAQYYAEQSESLTTLVRILGGVVASIMGLAAIFMAINSLYTAVSTRTREIATLRALGFRRGPVVVSVLVEALLLALLGGALGGLLAYVGFNGYQTSTLNFQSFSQVAFSFAVTPALLILGTVYAVGIGFLGALLPAWRAARLPIATALREQ
jgi:putative ABC transport system permease protein